MCKSLYYTVLGPSTLSDSNPVSRRFNFARSILICLTFFSLSLTLALNNQPTTQNNEDTPTSLPSQKKHSQQGSKRKRKKRRIKLVSYIYIPIYINPRKELE